MFVGTPGAGKSSLSRWMYEELARRGLPRVLLREQDVYALDALQAFSDEWSRADPQAIGTLLDAIRSLVSEWDASGAIWITDQFLPALHWQYGKYPPERVQDYARALSSILAPLSPVTFRLDADVRKAWERAVAERGQDWSDRMVEIFAARDLPLYPGEPIREVDDLLRFFTWLQSQSRYFFSQWPGKMLVLDTTSTPLADLQEKLLRSIGLGVIPRSFQEER